MTKNQNLKILQDLRQNARNFRELVSFSELKGLKTNAQDGHFTVYDVISEKNDIKNFKIIINGPPSTSFEGGKFVFNVSITDNINYPFKPPTVTALTKIFHPNISPDGQICLDILQSAWTPATKFSDLSESLSSFLNDPNPKDPLYPTASNLFISDRLAYEDKVKEYTKLYATIEAYRLPKQILKLEPDSNSDYSDSE